MDKVQETLAASMILNNVYINKTFSNRDDILMNFYKYIQAIKIYI